MHESPGLADSSAARRILLWALLCSVVVCIPLCSFEVAVRIVEPRSLATAHTEMHGDYNHRLTPNLTTVAKIAAEQYPVKLVSNSQALAQRKEVVVPKPDDLFRLMIVGDSFIQGLGEGKSLPEFLQAKLDGYRTADGRRIEVVNAGTQSYSPLLYHARFLHQFAAMSADAIFVFPDLTDVYDDWVRYRELAHYSKGELSRVGPSPAMVRRDRVKHRLGYDQVPLHAWKYLVAKIAHFSALELVNQEGNADLFAHAIGNATQARRQDVEFATANISRFVSLLRTSGIKPTLMLYPHEGQLTPLASSQTVANAPPALNRLFEQSLMQMAHEQDLPAFTYYDVFDLRRQAGDVLYFTDDMHFNLAGLQVLADAVFQTVVAQPGPLLGTPLVATNFNRQSGE